MLNHKGYSKSNRTQWQKYICLTNWGKLVFQIEAALFNYKLGQTLLQIGAASLLQIRASFVTNWGNYYKLGQPLLQNRAAVTNRGKMYYKLGQVLQIRAIITNWSITNVLFTLIWLLAFRYLPVTHSLHIQVYALSVKPTIEFF